MEDLNIRKELRELGESMLKEWGEELVAQGYRLTGRLINSLEYRVKKNRGEWCLDFFVESYGLIKNVGVAPNRIPFGGVKRAGGKSKFIEALIRFVKRRMRIGGKRGVGVAFAIAKTMKKQGSPTRRSFRYSKNGRRTGWIENGMNRKLKELDALLELLVGKKVELFVDKIFEEGMRKVA